MSLTRQFAGAVGVSVLEVIGRLPISLTMAFGTVLLPLYLPFRRKTLERLRSLTPPVSPLAYYRMRLRLSLLSLRHMLGRPDGCQVIVEGGKHFADARASGNAVVLLGWHQGPVELLHQLPAAHAAREVAQEVAQEGAQDGAQEAGLAKNFFLYTASAFSPALSEWMTAGRRAHGTTVIRPDDTAALRNWIRDKGVLAVMIDQVPGAMEDWLLLRNGKVRVPWPRRLAEWITTHNPVCLVVSVRWEPGDRIVFRYDRLEPGEPGALKEGVARLMDESVTRAREQYNWSYPKISVESTVDR